MLCGDGQRGSGESCDDGNTNGGDGCSATCLIEAGFTCPTAGQPCVPATTVLCGDGQLQAGEGCDDGNAMGGDGCSATCLIEAGFTCPTAGQPCVPATTVLCGDGQRGSGESCDDGNTDGGDGCSATCLIEAGYTCPTAGQPCVPDSGCASRSESTCNTDCYPIYGSPTGDLVNNRVYVGCLSIEIGCTAVMTCAYPAGQPDGCMLFSSGCTPSGWTQVANCGALASCPS